MNNMDAEEKLLEQRFGKKQPFTVPDGYFEQLAGRVMERLPEQQPAQPAAVHVPVRRRWYRWAAAAAVVGVVFAGTLPFIGRQTRHDAQRPEARVAAVQTDEHGYCSALDMAADYTMLDNEEIYAMVSENQ